MNRIEKAREFKRRIDANLQATRKLIRVDESGKEEYKELSNIIKEG